MTVPSPETVAALDALRLDYVATMFGCVPSHAISAQDAANRCDRPCPSPCRQAIVSAFKARRELGTGSSDTTGRRYE